MSKAILVQGLGYGDEGKGSMVDYLVRRERASLVVRFNGGAQAAHNVVLHDGRHHTFSQFGSGTFAGARTHLSRHMLVNPISMESEEAHLRSVGVADAYSRMTVERQALVTTPFHVALNRLKEIVRGDGRHGSCGMGIGETVFDSLSNPGDVLQVGDLEHEPTVRSKLVRIQERAAAEARKVIEECTTPRPQGFYREWDLITSKTLIDDCLPYYDRFRRAVQFVDEGFLLSELEKGTTIFEGAQGALLDQDFGFQPYTTWTDCTFGNAHRLLEGFTGKVTKLGVLRAFMTRHGAGPFVTEDSTLRYEEPHNSDGAWQKGFRLGHFDAVMLRYALSMVGGVDGLAITHLDQFENRYGRRPKVCLRYADRSGQEFAEIQVPRPFDLEAQTALTRKLELMTPIYETVPDENYESTLLHIEGAAQTPVMFTSYGPTADNKLAR